MDLPTAPHLSCPATHSDQRCWSCHPTPTSTSLPSWCLNKPWFKLEHETPLRSGWFFFLKISLQPRASEKNYTTQKINMTRSEKRSWLKSIFLSKMVMFQLPIFLFWGAKNQLKTSARFPMVEAPPNRAGTQHVVLMATLYHSLGHLLGAFLIFLVTNWKATEILPQAEYIDVSFPHILQKTMVNWCLKTTERSKSWNHPPRFRPSEKSDSLSKELCTCKWGPYLL